MVSHSLRRFLFVHAIGVLLSIAFMVTPSSVKAEISGYWGVHLFHGIDEEGVEEFEFDSYASIDGVSSMTVTTPSGEVLALGGVEVDSLEGLTSRFTDGTYQFAGGGVTVGAVLAGSFPGQIPNVSALVQGDGSLLISWAPWTMGRDNDSEINCEIEGIANVTLASTDVSTVVEADSLPDNGEIIISVSFKNRTIVANEETHGDKVTFREMVFSLGGSASLVPGDINNDSEINLDDSVLGLKVQAGVRASEVDVRADVDGDGKIGLAESIFALRYTAGLLPAEEYTITAIASDNGTITPSGEIAVEAGAGLTFTMFPDSGYQILDVLVNDQSMGALEEYTFDDVTSDQSIFVMFGPISPSDFSDGFDSSVIDGNNWDKSEPTPVVNNGILRFDSNGGNGSYLRCKKKGFYNIGADFRIGGANGNSLMMMGASWFADGGEIYTVALGLQTDSSKGDATIRAAIYKSSEETPVWRREVPVADVYAFVSLHAGYDAGTKRVEFWHGNTLFASFDARNYAAVPEPEFGRLQFWCFGDAEYHLDNVNAYLNYSQHNPDPKEVYVNAAATGPYLGTEANPHKTIQSALALVQVQKIGSRVHVASGIYRENLYLDRNRGWEDHAGVVIQGQPGTILEGDGSGTGILVKQLDQVSLENLEIRQFNEGVHYADNVSHGVIRNCTIHSNARTGMELSANYMHVTDCNIFNNGGRGVGLNMNKSDAWFYIERCKIQNNGMGGIYAHLLYESSQLTVWDSLITGNNSSGTDPTAGFLNIGRCTLANNTISDNLNGHGLSIESGSSQLIQVKQNIISGNAGYGFQMVGTGNLIANANNVWNNAHGDYQNVSNPGSDSISKDPKFVGTGDYHLSQASPCIGAAPANFTSSSDFDMDGEPRVQGSAVDIGADETPWEYGVPDGYVSATIGTEGGEVLLSDGTKLIVPANALASDTLISMGRPNPFEMGEISVDPPSELDFPVEAVELLPEGLSFSLPVSLELHYSEDVLRRYGIGEADEELLVPAIFSAGKNSWEMLLSRTIDTTNNTMLAQFEHFSLVELFCFKSPYFNINTPIQKGDLVYRLSGNAWTPGHVGIYISDDEVWDCYPSGVNGRNQSISSVTLEEFKKENGVGGEQPFLGARTHPSLQLSGADSENLRNTICNMAKNTVGNYITDGKEVCLGAFLWEKLASGENSKGASGNYSCVGYTESIYEADGVDLDITPDSSEDIIFWPRSQYKNAVPSNYVHNLPVGTNLQDFISGSLFEIVQGDYATGKTISVTSVSVPSSEFQADNTTLSWIPSDAYAGQTLEFDVTLTYQIPLLGIVNRIESQKLYVHVGSIPAVSSLPDSGQTGDYTSTFGEDSDYTINPPSYTKLDNEGNELPDSAGSWSMVRDNVTGLIWEVKLNDGGVHDRYKRFSWQETQNVFISKLNDDAYGGYSDWRIPTKKELLRIIDYDKYNPAINVKYFHNTVASLYWTSTIYAGYTATWRVNFKSGVVYDNTNQTTYYVRAVRGVEQVR